MGRRKRIIRPGLRKRPLEPETTPELEKAQRAQLALAEAFLSEGDTARVQLICRRVLQTKPLPEAWAAEAHGHLAAAYTIDAEKAAAQGDGAAVSNAVADAKHHLAAARARAGRTPSMETLDALAARLAALESS